MSNFDLKPTFRIVLTKKNYFFTKNTKFKTLFLKFWNIMEISKKPCKYHLSINLLAKGKPIWPITKKSKKERFSSQ